MRGFLPNTGDAMKYDHNTIEKKWQKFWEDEKTFQSDNSSTLPKYYVLDMFPYPSGAGLHVGHVVGYTATDIVARYKRMVGFNVLHPMGWDSFGLPAEQYAVRTGTHPRITTKANIDTYRRQLKSLGFSYDWSREIATSHPGYYKWTQWIFTELCKKGLAFEAETAVNFCPFLGTVLANEEVDNGKSKEGGHPVIKKPFRQWVLKITAYAERLLQDLELLDWPSGIKALQSNWIGKSEGTVIHFQVENRKEKISVFTTCAHTLFGATFVVLAPEHPLVDSLTTAEQKEAVAQYKEQAARESEAERLDMTKAKTGVFVGSYVINPANQERIPIWIADYVLATYGTGAVQAVPSHDARDWDFAHAFHLPLKPVVKPHEETDGCWEGDGTMIHSSNKEVSLDGLGVAQAKIAITDWLEKSGHGEKRVQYKLRDWLFSRQRYWGEPIPVLHFDDGTTRLLDLDELPLLPPEVSDYKPSSDGQSPLAKVDEWVHIQDPKTSKPARRETNTMPNWAGSCWYYLRFCDPRNSEQAWDKAVEKYWLPVDLYIGGCEHAVLHLLYARFWHKVLYDLGHVSTKEPFQALRNQGLIVAPSYKTKNNVYVAPEDVEERDGKYWHKKTQEELDTQIDKMSKSKLNGVTPDQIIEEYGADALRLYEMFMGPLEKEKVWNTSAVSGCSRFLQRAFDLVCSDKVCDEETEEGMKQAHRLVASAVKDLEQLQFNTVVAKMMAFLNSFAPLDRYPKKALLFFVQVLAPFAPHIAEEMWQMLGQKSSVAYSSYPVVDDRYLEESVVTYVVQVNGKLRARLDLPKDESEERLVQLAKSHQNVSKFLDGAEVVKVVFVPNKLINIVIHTAAS